MPRTVLVTGSLGYLGSRLTGTLMDAEYRVIGFDTGFFRDGTLFPPHDPETRLKDLRELHEGDLRGVDTVVHLAGISNDPMQSLCAERVYDPTRLYTLRLAELCKSRGIRFIFPSSCSVYGVGGDRLLTEESDTFPQTPYSLNKLRIEEDLRQLSDAQFAPIILRLATVFGVSPRIRFDVVINMLVGMALTRRAIILNSDGKAWRPHIHIDDVCKAIRAFLEVDPPVGTPLIVNVGETSQNFQIMQIAEMVQEQVPGCTITFLQKTGGADRHEALDLVRDQKIQDGVDTRTYRVSCERMKSVLKGFRCDWTVQRGIERMVRELTALRLTEAHFAHPKFYRLQTLESLLREGHLTEDLYWRSALHTTERARWVHA